MVSRLALICFQNLIELSTKDLIINKMNSVSVAEQVLFDRNILGVYGMQKLNSSNFTNIASCIAVTKSDSAVTISIALVEKWRSSGFVGSLSWKIELGQHPIEEEYEVLWMIVASGTYLCQSDHCLLVFSFRILLRDP